MKIFKIFFILSYLFAHQFIGAQDIIEFRNNGRTGVFNETGLLKKWPENGPKMLWSIENLPKGYSSLSIANNTIFVSGNNNNIEELVAVDLNGNEKWRTPFGKSWEQSYPLSRSTATVDGDRLYISSGNGEIACINANSGEIIWSDKPSEKYSGVYHRWGIAESLIVLDNKVFYTCGGPQTNTIAFDKMNGEIIWKSESFNDAPSYTSPLLIERKGKKIIVNLTENFIFGFQPEDGKILWKFDFGKYAGGKDRRNNQINTPLYKDGKLFVTSGYDHKSVMLNISEDLSSVSLAWVDSTLDVHHGGAVLLDGYIYGSNWLHSGMGNWVCLNWETGKVMYETEWENKGAIIAAEGMLYCYDEKRGNLALVKADPKEFKVISSFKIELGSGPHWGHPVIKDGILYVRHENALMAFDIKEK